jgi:hypothetical protein
MWCGRTPPARRSSTTLHKAGTDAICAGCPPLHGERSLWRSWPQRRLVDDLSSCGRSGSGSPQAVAGPRRSLEMPQMSDWMDSTLRLLDLADEGRFRSRVMCGDWTIGTNRENAGALQAVARGSLACPVLAGADARQRCGLGRSLTVRRGQSPSGRQSI